MTYTTRIDIDAKVRSSLASLLNRQLTAAVDMKLRTKQAHWNVTGPNFIALHELFDKLAGIMDEAVDNLAERVTALGHTAHGTLSAAAKNSYLPAYPADARGSEEHLKALDDSLALFGKEHRTAAAAAGDAGDSATEDLFIEIQREVDQYLWFIEAHLN